MRVHDDEWLCRFILPKYWNEKDNRPSPKAFRQGREISVFSRARVESAGNTLSDLAFGSLEGSGQAHLQTSDYVAAIAECESVGFSIEVEWRPETTDPDWIAWKDAHAQVEGTSGKFPKTYCEALVERVKYAVSPDGVQIDRTATTDPE